MNEAFILGWLRLRLRLRLLLIVPIAALLLFAVRSWLRPSAAVASPLIDDSAPELWELGKLDGRIARRHRGTGQVQVVRWWAGERQGKHKYDQRLWVNVFSDLWPEFKLL